VDARSSIVVAEVPFVGDLSEPQGCQHICKEWKKSMDATGRDAHLMNDQSSVGSFFCLTLLNSSSSTTLANLKPPKMLTRGTMNHLVLLVVTACCTAAFAPASQVSPSFRFDVQQPVPTDSCSIHFPSPLSGFHLHQAVRGCSLSGWSRC
jgi:hypothetical protein